MPLGRLFGVPVVVSWPFLGLLALGAGFGLWPQVLILAGTLLSHELAHLIVARAFGLEISRLELLPFGGVAWVEQPELDPHLETSVAMAGPLSNFLLLACGVLASGTGLFRPDLLNFFLEANLMMAVFNLLPALPLDGGRIYRAYLGRRWGYQRSTRRLASLGRVLALSLLLLGVVGAFFGRIYLAAVVMASFLYFAARKEEARLGYSFWSGILRKKELLRQQGAVPVHSLVVGDGTRLGELTRHFMARRYHLITVTGEDLQVLGTLDESQVVQALGEDGPDLTVGELLSRGTGRSPRR